MRLLICTQKVDINDDILGFFHSWIREFSKYCESVTVICLYKGEYDLPGNVKVFSLGKEKKKNFQFSIFNFQSIINFQFFNKIAYILKFYKYIFSEKGNYDKVFVHMNSEYAILGGWLWRAWGKKVGLWHNHIVGNMITRIGAIFADIIFYTSPFAFCSRYEKSRQMPAGIDTDIFHDKGGIEREKNSILYLGRISPVKNLDTLIEAVGILDKRGINFKLNIYGESTDNEYYKKIKDQSRTLADAGKVEFHGRVPHTETPAIYRSHEVFVNLTNSGSLDKTVLEAMACSCLTVVSNRYYEKILPSDFLFKERDAVNLAEKLEKALLLTKKQEAIKGLKEFLASHSLMVLVGKILKEINLL